MKHRWLTLLIVAVLSVLIFVLFSLRLRPIEIPDFSQDETITSVEQPTITFVNPSKGPADASVTIIEYGDFQCSACADILPTLDAVQKTFPNEVRIVWKNFPNESLHEHATPAAIAAHCAARQGRFWDYHDQLFARQELLSDVQYKQIARELDLDVDRFENCYQSRDTLPIVQKDFEEALGLGLSATPALYIGS